MLFADNPHDRQIEKMMSQIPNFKPRGHGIYVYEEKEYSAENCSCRECTHRRKKKRRREPVSPCVEQRIRAGELPLGEVIQETMIAIAHPAFQSRLKEYIYETEIMFMEFKNERHQAVFTEAVFHPVSTEAREELNKKVLAAYEQKLTEEQSQEQNETETLSEDESQAPVTQTM